MTSIKALATNIKQCEKYNILIGAIILSIVSTCLLSIITLIVGAVSGAIQLCEADSSWLWQFFLMRIIYSGIGIAIMIVCLSFITKACNDNSKLILWAVPLLIFMDYCSYGFAPALGHSAIICVCSCWIWKKDSIDIINFSKKLIVFLIVFMLIKTPFIVMSDLDMDGVTTSDYVWTTLGLLGSCFLNPEFFLAYLIHKKEKAQSIKSKTSKSKVTIIVWIMVAILWVVSNVNSFIDIKTEEEIILPNEEPVTELEQGDWSQWSTEDDL